jgi:NitT/TauT family transport system substrate-binding protein
MQRRTFNKFTAAVPLAAATVSWAQNPAMSLVFMLDFTPHGLHAPYFLAQQKGWFKEAGLNVTIQDGKGSVSVIQLAGAGKIDVGHAGLGAMAIAQSKGVPVKAVASILRLNPVGVLFSTGAGYKRPADFKGKELIYTASSLESPFVDSFLAAGNLKRSDLKLLATDLPSKISTYLSGKGDAVVAPIPYMMALMHGKRESEWLRFTDFGMPMLDYGMVVSEDTIKTKPIALAAFNRVVARAFAYVLDNHLDEGVKAIVDARPEVRLDKDVLATQFRAYAQYIFSADTQGKPVGSISAKDFEDTTITLKKFALIPSTTKASEFYTLAFNPI